MISIEKKDRQDFTPLNLCVKYRIPIFTSSTIMKLKRPLNLLLFLFCSLISFGQTSKTDSLKSVLNKGSEIEKINAYYLLAAQYENTFSDSAILYYESGIKLASKAKEEELIGDGYRSVGALHFVSGKFNEAILEFFKAVKISEKYHTNSKSVYCYQYLALAYNEQKIHDKALQYAKASLKLSQNFENKYAAGASNMLIGSIYYTQLNFDVALDYFSKGLVIMEEVNDVVGIADALNNVSLIYKEKKNYTKALEYQKRSLKMAEDYKNKFSIATSYQNIGALYREMKNYSLAISYLEKSLALSKEIDSKSLLKAGYLSLSELYAVTNKFELAYAYQNLFVRYQDTLLNAESKKQFAEMQTKYETEKKEAQINLMEKEKEKEALVTLEKHKKQNTIIWSIVFGLVIVVIFSAFMFRSLRVTRKQKSIIELQKKVVEEHQKDIIDSIHYAKRIQTSLLPTEKYIERILNKKDEGKK